MRHGVYSEDDKEKAKDCVGLSSTVGRALYSLCSEEPRIKSLILAQVLNFFLPQMVLKLFLSFSRRIMRQCHTL